MDKVYKKLKEDFKLELEDRIANILNKAIDEALKEDSNAVKFYLIKAYSEGYNYAAKTLAKMKGVDGMSLEEWLKKNNLS